MNKNVKIAIIGGGASGLFTAVNLLKNGVNDFVVLEKLDRVGKKLIATGNGQGNLSNIKISSSNYHSNKSGFYNYAINKHGVQSFKSFLNGIGVELCEDKGKIYPLSKQASSVLDLIRLYIENKNANVLVGEEVLKIEKIKGEYKITTINNVITSSYVIFACGGASQKQFGTDGKQYKLAQELNHKLTKTYPSLVQLKCDISSYKFLEGVKADVVLHLYSNNSLVKTTNGELLFTKFGVSGSAVFSISSYLKHNNNEKLVVEFLPNIELGELENMLKFRVEKLKMNANLFNGILHKKIGQAIEKTAKSLTIESLAKTAKSFELKIVGTLGFDYSQVTKGGISVEDICDTTMESKINKNLYLIGEYIDVDGDCGGYNLQWAYSSSAVAVEDIIKKGI